jgi:16S rRNA (guanine966-N2)-methyltransferase
MAAGPGIEGTILRRLAGGEAGMVVAFAFANTDRARCVRGMRISGGIARGIPLLVPKGDAVRPATDGVRQAVFSSLAARIAGSSFLDLFAGSGGYGLEAFSRGADRGIFVEKSPKAIACLRENIRSVCKSVGRSAELLEVRAGDALAWKPDGDQVPDLVFIDPPYELIPEVGPVLLAGLRDRLARQPDPLVVFEMPGEIALSAPGWRCVKRLGKGPRQPTVAFFRRDDNT